MSGSKQKSSRPLNSRFTVTLARTPSMHSMYVRTTMLVLKTNSAFGTIGKVHYYFRAVQQPRRTVHNQFLVLVIRRDTGLIAIETRLYVFERWYFTIVPVGWKFNLEIQSLSSKRIRWASRWVYQIHKFFRVESPIYISHANDNELTIQRDASFSKRNAATRKPIQSTTMYTIICMHGTTINVFDRMQWRR